MNRVGHLFAGAGGGLLASKILGHNNVFAVELERYPAEILRQRAEEGWFPRLSSSAMQQRPMNRIVERTGKVIVGALAGALILFAVIWWTVEYLLGQALRRIGGDNGKNAKPDKPGGARSAK